MAPAGVETMALTAHYLGLARMLLKDLSRDIFDPGLENLYADAHVLSQQADKIAKRLFPRKT
jgi:hypothetical protein